ncbi:ABC transporter permease subunit [bacterium]|nr:ABC transporter permease subunit [bacterium]
MSNVITQTRYRRPLIGPILPWELVTLARRWRYFAIRVLYAIAFLFMMWVTYDLAFEESFLFGWGTQSQPLAKIARFATGFYHSFLFTQAIVMLGLTPAFIATAIPQEKERKTIEYLFVSDLGNHEIVLGKVIARLANLFGILLVGVPVVAFAGLFGGIDYFGLFLGTAATAAIMTSVASLTFFVSLFCSTTRAALINSYGFLFFIIAGVPAIIFTTAGIAFNILRQVAPDLAHLVSEVLQNLWVEYFLGAVALIHPVSIFWLILSRSAGMAFTSISSVGIAFLALIAIHLTISAILILWSIRLLRISYRFTNADTPKRTTIKQRISNAIPRRRTVVSEKWPLYWKELRNSRFRKLGILARIFVIIGLCIFYYTVLSTISTSSPYSNQLKESLQFLTAMSSCGFIGLGFLIVAFRSASSIGEEKDRDCWISLLSTPVTSQQIIYAKALGSLSALQPFLMILLPLFAIDFIYEAMTLSGIIYLVLGVISYGFAIACLGVNQSLWQRTTKRAMTITIITSVILGGVLQMFLAPLIFFEEEFGKLVMASLPWTPLSIAPFLGEINDSMTSIVILSMFFMVGYLGIGFVLLSQCIYAFSRATGRIEV